MKFGYTLKLTTQMYYDGHIEASSREEAVQKVEGSMYDVPEDHFEYEQSDTEISKIEEVEK